MMFGDDDEEGNNGVLNLSPLSPPGPLSCLNSILTVGPAKYKMLD